MKNICANGHLIDDDELISVSESAGECHGRQMYQETMVCPICRTDELYDADCTQCKHWVLDERTDSYVCNRGENSGWFPIEACGEFEAV